MGEDGLIPGTEGLAAEAEQTRNKAGKTGNGGGAGKAGGKQQAGVPERAAELPVARVAVDVPLPHLDRVFDYLVPARLAERAVPGCRVRVRFHGKLMDGFLLERVASSDHEGRLVFLERVVSEEPVLTPEIAALAREVADRYAGTFADVVRLAVPPRHARAEKRAPSAPAPLPPPPDDPGPWASYPAGPSYLAALADGRSPRAVWTALPGPDWPAAVARAARATASTGRGVLIVLPDGRQALRLAKALTTELTTPSPHPDAPPATTPAAPASEVRTEAAPTALTAPPTTPAASPDAPTAPAPAPAPEVRREAPPNAPTAPAPEGRTEAPPSAPTEPTPEMRTEAPPGTPTAPAPEMRAEASPSAPTALGRRTRGRADIAVAAPADRAAGSGARAEAWDVAAVVAQAEGSGGSGGSAPADAADAGAAEGGAACGERAGSSSDAAPGQRAGSSADAVAAEGPDAPEGPVEGSADVVAGSAGGAVAAGGGTGGSAVGVGVGSVASGGAGDAVVVVSGKGVGGPEGGVGVVVLRAEDGPERRYREWLRVLRGEARIVVGTRAAMFAPVRDLGLVVLWDDGDDVHAEPHAPYPHAREVLVLRAHRAGAAALFGGVTRTADATRLVETGWARPVVAARETVRAVMPRVRPAGEDAELARDEAARVARLTALAFRTARAALADGPVLVQVPRRGYLPALACAQCREPARCPACAGPLALGSAGGAPACRWCGAIAGAWRCPECGGTRVRAVVVGAGRTAEELGRAFPGVTVRTSGRDGVLAEVSGRPELVVSTPGAEPVAEGGYAAALLLDGWAMLGRPDLRVNEEALRRWLNAAALVRPQGAVVLAADGALPVVQAVVRWDPVTFAERELAERRELRFPPAARMASLTGPPAAIRDLLDHARLPDDAELLGPVPHGDPTADDPRERALLRVPRTASPALARALKEAQSIRSARRPPDPVRIQLDPLELL
ncbi:primosomal protein N' [Actinocorallia sp. A-T 12471]|uniref:primosomal protein N' family DNA-binding protein n=1 Tax=Actinocorallia sp. A-T 12471 TaxID=3089813 RepID=UPI0029CD4429|nr:primosomal protein N' [Actinocorallia sp. A-T 12471]MDX6743124.1 primosomal protein N' [Actinocorallia sp. A-T 12471]